MRETLFSKIKQGGISVGLPLLLALSVLCGCGSDPTVNKSSVGGGGESAGNGTASAADGASSVEAGGKPAKSKTDPLPILDYKPAPIDGYAAHADGGIIYNPLSAEAKKVGAANRYDGAKTSNVSLQGNGFNVTFSVPTEITAYDMVPIKYTLNKTGSVDQPLTLIANAFEEPGRGTGSMYDLSVPGKMDVEFTYLGSVTGTLKENARHVMKPDNSDTPAEAYPNYTLTELNPSGTVKSGDIVWLKFRYTNTGNTILDPEGIGGFSIVPRLYRKESETGTNKAEIGKLYNNYVRETTYVYPGESREFWVNFISSETGNKTPQQMGLNDGHYQIELKTIYRTEYNYDMYTNLWDGRVMQTAYFDFNAAAIPTKTPVKPIVYTNKARPENKASWLHYFEEFMTVYEQFRQGLKTNETGTLWLQVAPWSKQIVLKAVYANPKEIAYKTIPVRVNTDINVTYNPDNFNTVINADGIETPMIYSQPMSDMRANVQRSPYPEQTIATDLLEMRDCGINLLTTQGMPWLYDNTVQGYSKLKNSVDSNTQGDGVKYQLDISRNLGFQMLGIGSYPLGRPTISQIANWIDGKNYLFSKAMPGEGDYSDPNVAKANAVAYNYQRSRWGDLYAHDRNGTTSYTIEDTRGFMRLETHARWEMGNKTVKAFQQWTEEKYKTVAALNKVWGTKYKAFTEIDPQKGQEIERTNWGNWVHYENRETGFYENAPATFDADIFRTQLRVKNYEDVLADVRKQDPEAMVSMRTEGSVMVVPGLDPQSKNPHYRNIIYSQLCGAAVAEVLAGSDAIRSHTDYTVIPFTPSEIAEVTKKAVAAGIVPMLQPQFDNMRETLINDVYGEDFSKYYNISAPKKAAMCHVLTAVYPWWKATYENGGVPGVLWQDYECDGFVTETQKKEMKFFSQKLNKAINEPKALETRKKNSRKYAAEQSDMKNAYQKNFVDKTVGEAIKNYGEIKVN